MRDPDLSNAALVVAHPDDEILWFSSILAKVSRTVVCFSDIPRFPDRGEKRRKAMAAYPVRSLEALDLAEPDSFMTAGWPNPRPGPHGFLISRSAQVAKVYGETFDQLTARLRDRLRGCSVVYTHNPWGEYGHEDHGLVHAAVLGLRAELGFEVYFSSYVSQRNLALFQEFAPHLDTHCRQLPTDRALAEQAEALYRQHDCWTWFDGYAWPEQEAFLRYREPHVPAATPPCWPLNFILVDLAVLPMEPKRRNVLQHASDKLKRKIRRRLRRFTQSAD